MGGGVISASMVISDEIEGLQMLPLIVLDRFSSAAWNTEGAVGGGGGGGGYHFCIHYTRPWVHWAED